jgi:uncharacterized membrane protein
MALDDFYSNCIFFLRWLHIMAGITWIGLLYFFNFVNVPFQGVIDKELKPRVNPPLLLRALWWFRWAAMVTMVIGWCLLLYKYGQGNLWTDAEGKFSQRAMWILFGGTLGTIMWFNVWFVIWPAQRQIIRFLQAGQAPPEMPALAKRALLFSRINTFLSGPMLFGMIAPNNYGAISVGTMVVVIAVGLVVPWGLIKMSAKVGQTI